MRRMSVDRNRKQSRQARDLARAAILLAIAALVQWIRLVLPLPPVVSLLLIGTVVNLCLCLSVWSSSLKLTAVSCLLLPVFAYVQGHLAFWPLVPVIFAGNLAYCLAVHQAAGWKDVWPPLLKALVLWGGTGLAASLFHLPAGLRQALLLTMALPQWTTAALGLAAGLFLWRRLRGKIGEAR